jgi:hypothetical protein
MTLILPYVASCIIAGEKYDNLEVVEMTGLHCKVRLPNGDIVKRNYKRHKVELAYIRMEK